MTSHSQAGQDLFAYVMRGRKTDGVFLDVGAHDGVTNSNSLGLEEIGWRGLLVDIHCFPGLAARKNDFVIFDAAAADWKRTLELYMPFDGVFDYLSLDVDESTTATLERLLDLPIVFAVITIEHDAYRLGAGPRNRQRDLLLAGGYDLVCSDVVIEAGPGVPGQGGAFEDWWASPEFVSKELRDRYRCHNQIGRTITANEDFTS
jgi:hypothetical protein